MTSPTFVYFVATRDRSMIKIGCSQSPEHRLSGLQVWSPVPLDILAFVPGTLNDERALHRRYLTQYSHKEWFKSTPEMLADIEAIARFGELPTQFKGRDQEPNPIIANHSVRRTPEWRAKVSLVHKARWAREKKSRALNLILPDFLSTHGLTSSELNALIGLNVVNHYARGEPYFSCHEHLENLERAEQFMASYTAPEQARAS